MYTVENRKEYPIQMDYSDFGTRITELLRQTGNRKIVYIATEFNNSTFRYRFYNFRQTLLSSRKFDLVCFETWEIPQILPYIRFISLFVMQRTEMDNNVNNLLALSQHYSIPVAYDVDDLIYNPNFVLSYVNNLGWKVVGRDTIKHLYGMSIGHWLVAKECDCSICTTPDLKDHLSEDFQRPVYIVPNYYNQEQKLCSEEALRARTYRPESFCIGYFSGSPSHQNDFNLCQDALAQLMTRYPDVTLKIVGFMSLRGKLKQFHQLGRVEIRPLCSYQELQYEIAGVDVNIAPLVRYPFNACKSELKFFEAGLVKVPSVVSKIGVYPDIIDPWKNGVLCDESEWFDSLEQLYLQPDLRHTIAENAHSYAVEHYRYDRFLLPLEELFEQILRLR